MEKEFYLTEEFQLVSRELNLLIFKKKKKSKQKGSDAAQGPQTSDGERRQEGPQPGHEEPPSGRGQWMRAR